jgi:hypothetical protein
MWDIMNSDVGWAIGLLALLLLWMWVQARKWSKVPPAPKRPRQPLSAEERARRRRLLWFAAWW